MSRIPHLYGATFAFILNEKGEILLQQRQNTWYYDGWRQVPSGHIDDGETALQSIRHECLEEININITVNESNIFHIIHRISTDRQYIDIWVKIDNRIGAIKNNEPEKCSALERFSFDNLPSYISPVTLRLIEAYQNRQLYSEIIEHL